MSLNQAWEPFSKQGVIGRENIRRVSERIWDTLKRRRDVPVGLRTSIDLACSGHNDDLARGYEQGHICGLYYAAGSLPGEDQLEKDLECMLKVYASLVDMFIGENNANPFDQYQALIPEVCETSDSVSSILHDFSELVPVDEFREVPFPGSAPRVPSARPRRSAPYKPDYELMQKQRKRSGEKGEQMAMRLLKHLYPSCEILHVSTTDDGAGFDIRVSGSAVGEDLHVEVKATEKKVNIPLFIYQPMNLDMPEKMVNNLCFSDYSISMASIPVITGSQELKCNILFLPRIAIRQK